VQNTSLVSLTKPSGSHYSLRIHVRSGAQHVLLHTNAFYILTCIEGIVHTGFELHAVAPSSDGSEIKYRPTTLTHGPHVITGRVRDTVQSLQGSV